MYFEQDHWPIIDKWWDSQQEGGCSLVTKTQNRIPSLIRSLLVEKDGDWLPGLGKFLCKIWNDDDDDYDNDGDYDGDDDGYDNNDDDYKSLFPRCTTWTLNFLRHFE